MPSIFKDAYNGVKDAISGLSFRFKDGYQGPKGEVFLTLEDADGNVLEDRHFNNVITQDFSILVARLCKDSLEPRHGVFMLAVGTGDSGWDLQNPPAATDTQRSLYNEIDRKAFSETIFRDSGGSPSSIPTNIVDFKTVFTETEAVGPLVEMGLLGGDVNQDTGVQNPVLPPNGAYDDTEDLTGQDTLANYFTFPVINKPAGSTLTLVWRITF